jgi:hypothetical protein
MRQANETRELSFALPRFDIRLRGRAWHGSELSDRIRRLGDCKIEVLEGRLLGDEFQRRMLLGLILENVGLEAAVSLADPRIWDQALRSVVRRKQLSRAPR